MTVSAGAGGSGPWGLTRADTMVIAWLGFIGYAALGFASVQYGSGKHQWDVRLPDFIQFLQVGQLSSRGGGSR
jgi:hypothetical protein